MPGFDNYQDFRCFTLNDDGERDEIEIDQDNISELFDSEGVYLFVRNDLRRLFIWKGPKSPVRKRFISSRVGAKIQEETAKFGMHLKIVSVDAGDEPIEFLRAFNVDPYEVQDHERLNDMYYIRNEDRRKMEDAALQAKLDKNKDEKQGYWSPVLGDSQREEQIQQAKTNAVNSIRDIAPSSSTSSQVSTSSKPKIKTYSPPSYSSNRSPSVMSAKEKKEVLDSILANEEPEGLERLNIIIGTTLYSPNKSIASVFGKSVETIKWDEVPEIPDGNIDIKTTLLRAVCKDNQVLGMIVYQKEDGNSSNVKTVEKNASPSEQLRTSTAKKTSTKRALKEIPKG